MTSKENLVENDTLQQEEKVSKSQGEGHIELRKNKEPSQSNTGDSHVETKATIDTTELTENSQKDNAKETRIEKSSSQSGAIMQDDATDFIEINKEFSLKSEGAVKCVSSFRLEFLDVAGFSVISPTKVWVHNFHKLKLVDIGTGIVLRSYFSEHPFKFVNGLNDNIVFLTFHYEIDRLSVNEDGTNNLKTLLNFSSGIEQTSQCKLNAFTLSKSGDFIVCLTRRTGCLCFAKELSYVERFNSRGEFSMRSKIQHQGKYLVREAYDVVESSNGDICIAAEKYQGRGEFWVVVLDSKFNFRFSYDRNTTTQIHMPASLATDKRNNILIVNKFRDRVKRKQNQVINKKKKELTYVAIIDEDGIFREHLPTEAFNTEGIVTAITTDSDGKIWIIMDSGQIIVTKFDYLAKTEHTESD